MRGDLNAKALVALRLAIAALPWLLSMYTFFWLDRSGTWTSETPHRGKMSVALLAAGMAISFLVYSRWSKRGDGT